MKIKIVLSIFVVLVTLENSSCKNENSPDSEFDLYKSSLSKHKDMISLYKEQIKIKDELTLFYKSNFESVQSNFTKLHNQLGIYETQLKNQANSTADYENKIQIKTELLNCVNKSLIEIQNKLNLSENSNLRLQQQLNSSLTDLDAKVNEIETKKATISELNITIENLNDLLKKYEEQNRIGSKVQEGNEKQIQNLETNLISCNEKVKEKSQDIDDLKSQISANTDKFKELNEMIDSFGTCCKANSCLSFGNSSNIHTIQVTGVGPCKVLCDGHLNGPGWTVIQRRINGSVDFYRNWTEYKDGFGDLTGEFFIGLEKLHHMTKAEPQELYIYLEDFEGEKRYIQYDKFEIGSEEESYALKPLGNSEGEVSDMFYINKGSKFSTFDKDNDSSPKNCAETLHGAWWYYKCGLTNLNGRYQIGDAIYDTESQGIFWADEEWHDYDYSLKTVQIMIRPSQKSVAIQ